MNPLNLIGSKPTPEHLSGRGSEFVAGIHNRLQVMDLAVQRVREEAFMNNRTLFAEAPVPIENSPQYALVQAEQHSHQQPNAYDFPITQAQKALDNQLAEAKPLEAAPIVSQTVEQPSPESTEMTQPGMISEAEALARVNQIHDEFQASQRKDLGLAA